MVCAADHRGGAERQRTARVPDTHTGPERAGNRPLYRVVAQMALSAAFDDPRFPPLTKSELPGVHIEISRLSPLVPGLPEEVCPGRHGVCVTQGDHRGVFLPQVALEYHWDRETLLRELCRKALLPPDAWRQPGATLMIFEAEVFGEEAASR
jgi:AmmeMemoRadiSam system protein A